MPAVGSSISRSTGSWASAIASSTRLRSPGLIGHPDLFEQGERLLAIEAAGFGPEAPRPTVPGKQRLLDILSHGHGGEGLRDLKGPSDAEPPDAARRKAHHLVPAELDAAGVRAQLAAQAVEAGCLAGAVRSDQGEQLARVQPEAHILDRPDAAKRLGEPPHLEDSHQAGSPWSRRRCR
jgi:hypothetical protein